MTTLTEKLPDIIKEAAKSNLGILALMSIALSVLAYFFFASASEKVKVGTLNAAYLAAEANVERIARERGAAIWPIFRPRKM